MADSRKKRVLITGFGVFRDYDTNPSWESVRLLAMTDVQLIKHQIPVVYDAVNDIVPKLWDQHQPDIVIHCGVSCYADGIVLETNGHGCEYKKCDVNGCIPAAADTPNPSRMKTAVDIHQVCEKMNQAFEKGMVKLPTSISDDAGRYLCEYVFNKSLSIDPRKTVFIHVPEFTKFSVHEITEALELTVRCLLEVLEVPEKRAGDSRKELE